MPHTHSHRRQSLSQRFPPSPPCICAACVAFCRRPGWWAVEEAARALRAGFGGRMMLELDPARTFGVISPAFSGCEGGFALQEMAGRGCNFLKLERCELFGSGLEPLECRYCHHERKGLGDLCHAALEKDWHTAAGQALVEGWAREFGLWGIFTRLTRPAANILRR